MCARVFVCVWVCVYNHAVYGLKGVRAAYREREKEREKGTERERERESKRERKRETESVYVCVCVYSRRVQSEGAEGSIFRRIAGRRVCAL